MSGNDINLPFLCWFAGLARRTVTVFSRFVVIGLGLVWNIHRKKSTLPVQSQVQNTAETIETLSASNVLAAKIDPEKTDLARRAQMSILAILGLVAWAVAVAVIIGVLIATGKSEDKRHAENLERTREAIARQPLPHAACYEDCMRDFLWNPRKEVACAASCGL